MCDVGFRAGCLSFRSSNCVYKVICMELREQRAGDVDAG